MVEGTIEEVVLSIFNFLSQIVSPVTDLIDEMHTSDEEKLTIKSKMMQMEHELSTRFLDYEKQLLTAQSNIIVAEAKGDSFLQRSWRPITMLTFLGLVVADSFGWLANPLASEAWTLLQLGLGGYVVGRSAEKTVKVLKK